ncbi:uncharacterized protein LOC115874911 [Sitophilus oryzae]|uniref:Uncharacterized protein LOC115874911 n=1 Tax=Sitophilus oryzae TaxID=7048 RepID=A0A6J2X560_SITOR|nr:uncharacterized protein LOC115874911 [Sitophilus oryzae]
MFSRTVESGVQVFSRTKSRGTTISGINPHFFEDGEPLPGQLIELLARDHVNYVCIMVDLIVRAILPPKYYNEFKGVKVILFDTNSMICVFMVRQILEKKLEPFNLQSDEKKTVVEEALKNLSVIKCYTLEEFEITIRNFEDTLDKDDQIGLVILDDVFTQYWCAQFCGDDLSYEEYCLKYLRLLHNAIKDSNVTMIYHRSVNMEFKKSGFNILAYSIDVSLEDVPDFYDGITYNGIYSAVIKNLEKNTTKKAQFRIKDCLLLFNV